MIAQRKTTPEDEMEFDRQQASFSMPRLLMSSIDANQHALAEDFIDGPLAEERIYFEKSFISTSSSEHDSWYDDANNANNYANDIASPSVTVNETYYYSNADGDDYSPTMHDSYIHDQPYAFPLDELDSVIESMENSIRQARNGMHNGRVLLHNGHESNEFGRIRFVAFMM